MKENHKAIIENHHRYLRAQEKIKPVSFEIEKEKIKGLRNFSDITKTTLIKYLWDFCTH